MDELHSISLGVSSFGGPSINTNDLTWALDDPAGMKLVSWLSNQMRRTLDDDDSEIKVEKVRAVLHDITLENEEVKRLEEIGQKGPLIKESRHDSLGDYCTPSELRHDPFLSAISSDAIANNHAEIDLRNEQLEYLKRRLDLTRRASEELEETIHWLKHTVKSLDTSISDRSERLENLSLEVDNTIASTREFAVHLLLPLGSQVTDEKQEIPQTREEKLLEEISAARMMLLSPLDSLKPGFTPDPYTYLVESDVEELHRRIEDFDIEDLKRGAFLIRLEKLCEALENGEDQSGLLTDRSDEVSPELTPGLVDCREEIRNAWNVDQMATLKSNESLLDQTLEALPEQIISPLEALHAHLLREVAHTREAEVLIRVFGEELCDLKEDTKFGKQKITSEPDSDSNDATLEQELRELLVQLKRKRPASFGPLILLDRDDIVKEIHSLVTHARSHQQDPLRDWQQTATSTLKQSKSHIHGFLGDVVYANSAVNTSPPFRYSTEGEDVCRKAKETARFLDGEGVRFKKALDGFWGNEKHVKKLDVFVKSVMSSVKI
ncbi:hypothetical protein FA15DRAFT_758396 [Coprinopsis marcescibilis]|uniref:Uncharacterized protein n=1 Tax=Coprinopsis marcescibilis TaxID=230819 RepID=A0A5C3KN41_COPMA|nr:hypothetical protein FA15DRAFT_758396 [Coprinopsis marcescibilis]